MILTGTSFYACFQAHPEEKSNKRKRNSIKKTSYSHVVNAREDVAHIRSVLTIRQYFHADNCSQARTTTTKTRNKKNKIMNKKQRPACRLVRNLTGGISVLFYLSKRTLDALYVILLVQSHLPFLFNPLPRSQKYQDSRYFRTFASFVQRWPRRIQVNDMSTFVHGSVRDLSALRVASSGFHKRRMYKVSPRCGCVHVLASWKGL